MYSLATAHNVADRTNPNENSKEKTKNQSKSIDKASSGQWNSCLLDERFYIYEVNKFCSQFGAARLKKTKGPASSPAHPKFRMFRYDITESLKPSYLTGKFTLRLFTTETLHAVSRVHVNAENRTTIICYSRFQSCIKISQTRLANLTHAKKFKPNLGLYTLLSL